jgi:hypothetical protein
MIPLKQKYFLKSFENPDNNNDDDDVKGNIESSIIVSDNTTSMLAELNRSKVKAR